jgi:cytochrome c oxidase assembly factor CtaG
MTSSELLLSAWRFDPIVAIGAAIAVAAYTLAPGGGRAGSRAAYLSASITVLAVALVSPVGALADGYLFSAHMLQHLLLLLVVPPLALLGVGPRGPSRPSSAAAIPSPLVPGAWLAGVAAMWMWHAPTLCNAATRSAPVHLAQEASLLLMGTWFFWPLLSPKVEARLPPLSGIVYLFTACTACTLLGVAVTFSPVEICSAYLAPVDRLGALPLLRGSWGLTPEKDQQLGGLFMWLPACLVYGAGILGILARWYGESDGEARAEDAGGAR